MRLPRFLLAVLVPILISVLDASAAGPPASRAVLAKVLRNGGALVLDAHGAELFSHRADEHFIPASTLKLATVAAALDGLGAAYRFPTEFFLDSQGRLYVKGYGDPRLVSEELRLIAKELAGKLTRVSSVILDDTYFAETRLDGASSSTNPYDATNGALLVNFNTVYLERLPGGEIRSAESQTPLTPLARSLGGRLSLKRERINLGPKHDFALRYFGELLIAFLRNEGIDAGGTVSYGSVPPGAKLILRHLSSQTLEEVSRGLLEYSTNFSANQIFLALGAKRFGAPATADKGARAVGDFLRKELGFEDFTIVEGAGLSRKNRLTPRQMTKLLDRYAAQYGTRRSLLPVEKGRYHAKTGSLTGVSTLCGLTDIPGRGEARFAILVNDNVPANYKFVAADRIVEALSVEKPR